jgi:two-component system chemotaxis response regulator CheB
VIKVMVVDDSALMRKLLGQIFATDPEFQVQFARNGSEALAQVEEAPPDVITLDIQMPVMDGLTCLDRIMIEHPCPVVMVSSLTAEGADATLEALRLGAVDFVEKPDGAISLRIDELSADLLSKVRSAAGAKLRRSTRLTERVRHRIGRLSALRDATGPPATAPTTDTMAPMHGDGLVVVGTSTGGPNALETLLEPLPADFPWPIVIAQHMPATFTAALASRLNGLCAINVVEVAKPTPLEPGTAYIGRGGGDIVIARRGLTRLAVATAGQRDYPWHPSADRLVRTAMEHVPPTQIVGVLMTGMGNDGAEAMTALHAAGGRTIAELNTW